jgi:hypothetical protein
MSFTTPYRQLLDDARVAAPERPASPAPAPSRRLLAWLRQGSLERRLLDGVAGDGLLGARAWQLTRPRACERVAGALDAVLAEAAGPVARGGSAVPVRREEVTVARDEIVRVAERLRDPRPVRPRGVVMLRRLLRDGNGPLYAPSANDALWRRLRRAAIALD